MKKLLFLLLIPFSAYAVDPAIEPETILNCDMPVQREDDTALAIDEIMLVSFYLSDTSGGYTISTPYQTNIICQVVIDNTVLSDGTYYLVGTATDTDWRASVPSVERTHIVKRIAPPKSLTWAVSP